MTGKRIGLGAPVFAILGFAVLFNPYTQRHLPRAGWAHVILSPQTLFLVSVLAIAWIRRLAPADIGLTARRIKFQLGLGLTLGLAPAVLTVVIALSLMGMDALHPFLPRPILGGPPTGHRFDAPNLVSLLLLAPITEELFFRGVLLRALREAYNPFLCVVFSSLIFMGGHGGLAVGPLLLGLITAPVALATGTLLPGMIFHAVCNAYGPILTTWFPNLYRYLDFFFQ